MKRNKISMHEIQQWIDNDEGLYNWYRFSRLSMNKFIKENREELETCINRVVSGERKPHYLIYG